MHRWTEEEDATLSEHYPTHGAVWDGWTDLLPSRTASGISYRAQRLGIKCVVPYTPRSHGELETANDNAEMAVRALGEWERLRLRLLVRQSEHKKAGKE